MEVPMGDDKYNESTTKKIPVITHEMLNRYRYYPLVVLSNVGIRTIIYPFTNITTKLQDARGNSVYSGIWDCIVKTKKHDGYLGFYKGGAVRIFGQLPAGFMYITTYERVRHHLLQRYPGNDLKCSACAGAAASVVTQFITNPVDIISQTLILIRTGNQKSSAGKSSELPHIPDDVKERRGLSRVMSICKCIYHERGIFGLWKGYLASTFTYGISSSLWWFLYHIYSDNLFSFRVIEETFYILQIKAMAGILGGMTTTFFTNPLDLVRLRMQMQKSSYSTVVGQLLEEEGLRMFTKALTPRLLSSIMFSCFAIVGYETVKYVSLSEEYTIPL